MQSIFQYHRLRQEARQQLEAAEYLREALQKAMSGRDDDAFLSKEKDKDGEDINRFNKTNSAIFPSSEAPLPLPAPDIESSPPGDLLSLSPIEDPKQWSFTYKWAVTGLVGEDVVAWVLNRQASGSKP